MSNKPLKYYQFLDNISGDELFKSFVGYGMFPEKLPPIFTSLHWLHFFEKNIATMSFPERPTQYIFYETMRNTNVPRIMGIPNPITYTILCHHIKNYWFNIRTYFKEKTITHTYKKSRIHIRKLKNSQYIFRMNYGHHSFDGDPELDLLFDAHYMVKADISQCFPSMYSHALAWALVGKEKAKENKDKKDFWYNQLDYYARNIKDGETNGFLIGPHVSNLLSEIILCTIDSMLDNWKYFRKIDDYTCFVKDQQEAENFLVELNMALKEFGLNLNHKKTEIIKLPIGQEESWVRKLKNNFALYANSPIKYPQIHAFMEFVIDLVKETGNSAVINYAMQMVCKCCLTESARQYYIKIIAHLSLIYTYLFPYLDEYLFIPFNVSVETIRSLSELIYKNGNRSQNAESISYALFFAIKYRFIIDSFDTQEILEKSDCILNSVAWKYAKNNHLPVEPFESLAKNLSKNEYDFNRNWLFVYEVLSQNELKDIWAAMKKQGVSFIIPNDDVYAKISPDYETIDFDFNISCNCESFIDFIEELWKDYIIANPLDNNDEKKNYFKLIVLNLRIAYTLRRNVIIPKSKEYYEGNLEAGENVYTIFMSIISWLKTNHFIGERLGDPEYGYTSYWGMPKLYSRFSAIPTGMVMKDASHSSSVVMKDSNKRIVEVPFSSKAFMYESQLNAINEFYSSQTFSYFPASCEEEFLFPRLTAIFNNNSWNDGGRLYSSHNRGINYQAIPSDLRETIRINGRETVEIDFSGLHVSMLYAQNKLEPQKDPYNFLPGESRQLAKFATLVMINTSNEAGVVASLEKRKKELQNKQGLSPKKRALKQALETCPDFSCIVDSIKKNHAAISNNFFTGIGIKLQNIDSLMALEIINSFYKRGIPVLPMHDSFIIDKQYSSELKDKMREVFGKYNNGFSCKIK